jgi:hypothetical protein
MTHDTHDDGLVHSHDWAKEPPPAVGEILRAMGQDIAAAMNVKQDMPAEEG